MPNGDIDLSLSKDLLKGLQDPEFNDIKIIASDGEVVTANKVILSMRSRYFRSMFSANNNFVESQAGSVKMPYSKAVLDKVIIYLYSGKMDCEDLALRPLMDLLELLKLMNLSTKFSELVDFTVTKIKYQCTFVKGWSFCLPKKGKTFPLSDCLKSLDDSSKLGLEKVEETLLELLVENLREISQTKEVGVLSETMMTVLIQFPSPFSSPQTIHRFRTFVTWLSTNSMNTDSKDELLKMFNFEDFTFEELLSDVRKSGLYSTDQVMERMVQLFQGKVDELKNTKEELKTKDRELKKLKKV